jgi:carboxyl-terminal processing protease
MKPIGGPLALRSSLSLTLALLLIGVPAFAEPPKAESLDKNIKKFADFYNVIEQNFADKLDSENAIYKGAIPGMLNTLDPHSHFFDPKEFEAMQQDNREVYYGTGMNVRPDGKWTIVVAPFPGSPAFRAGLRPGDRFVAIDGVSTEGLDTTGISTRLKGPRGTQVSISVARHGVEKPITVSVTRDQIPRPSVSEPFWLRPGIAYIKVSQFKERTSGELEDNLKKLGEDQVQGLVLDLRGNPGGVLPEGIGVASHFLKKGQLVVSDRGRIRGNTNYTARGSNGGKDYSIVVLVNRNSASAAEIVSGALQDHDRAWVLGETTFGKGLVQEVTHLSDNAGLALTTMHYYTPSGRLIQRDYSKVSFLDYYFNAGQREQKNLDDVKKTDSGRTVYGGGGITPDEKYASTPLNSFQITLLRRAAFFKFSADYFGPREDAHLPKGWEPDDALVESFHHHMQENKVPFAESEYGVNRQWVKEQLKREMYITAFNQDASDRVGIEQDPEVARAVDAMPRARALLETARKLVVRR